MIYRGYEIKTGWPLGQPVQVIIGDVVVHEFPFETKDETIMDWIDAHRRAKVQAGKQT